MIIRTTPIEQDLSLPLFAVEARLLDDGDLGVSMTFAGASAYDALCVMLGMSADILAKAPCQGLEGMAGFLRDLLSAIEGHLPVHSHESWTVIDGERS